MRARLRDIVFLLVVLGGAGTPGRGPAPAAGAGPVRPSRPVVARDGSRPDRRPGRRDVPAASGPSKDWSRPRRPPSWP